MYSFFSVEKMKKNGIAKYIHFIISIAIFCLFWSLHLSYVQVQIDARYSLFVYVIYAVLFYFFARTYNCYQLGYDTPGELLYSQFITSLICIFGAYLGISIIWNHFYPLLMFILAFVCQMIWNVIWSFAATKTFFHNNPPQSAAIVYRNNEDLNHIREIYDSRLFRIEKEINISDDTATEDILKAVEGYKTIFVTGVSATLRNGLAKYCSEADVQGYFIPHVGDVIMAGAQHVQSFSVPLQLVQRADPDIGYAIIKRGCDVILSLLGIVILSPVMLIIALAIKINDGGSIIYRQERLTKDGRHFMILKFRSMKENAEADGVARKALEHDDRITGVGRVIRACRMDELPQLFNIFKGDMSIVGPRPERPELAEELSRQVGAFNLRLQVKAGLTGYAQVYGKYNTDPSDKLKMDLIYINRMNLIMDIQLIFATIKILFVKDSTEGVKENR